MSLEKITYKSSNNFEALLDNIQKRHNVFVDNKFKTEIFTIINDFFPNLNSEDKKALNILTGFIIDIISMKYSFEKTESYYYQWKQNNYRDLKGVILLLLPFIDDKLNGYLLENITDLNQLLYSHKSQTIPTDIHNLVREDILGTHFEYGNMGIGLIPTKIQKDTDYLLDLYPNNEKLIYKLIHHNLIGLLQTLDIMNGKSYINWVNIVPLNLSNYIESKLYKETKSRLNFIQMDKTLKAPLRNYNNFGNLLVKNMTNYSGVWFGDIYNVIRIKLYEEAKPIKWLFFPYEISEDNKIYLIQGLNKMISINNIINSKYKDWDDIELQEQNDFEKQLKLVITELELNRNITGSFKADIEILRYTLVYLISNYFSKKNIDIKGILKQFKLNDSEQDQLDDDFNKNDFKIISTITNDEIIECLKIVHSKYCKELWNYLNYVIEQLSNTSYYKYLIVQDDKTNQKSISLKYYYEPFNINIKTNEFVSVKQKINLKNIYNISKSLSHNNSKDWNLLEPNFLSISDIQKHYFFFRIFNIDDKNNWINLRGNLKRQVLYDYIDYIDYNSKINEILSTFKIIFINLIFEELVTNGVLNKFVLNREITDKLLLPKNTGQMISKKKELLKKTFEKNKSEWDESYYYLTNDKFKNLNKMRLDKEKVIDPYDKYNEMVYFDIIYKDHGWPSFYAMDWVSQISFFQHYIYHQVLYVTGATGQGKSTQVPKLLLYALKVIDYKSDGKVVCTQPRVTPTVGNATRIADELGLPIEQTSNTSPFKIKTDNYWVQYKHQKDSHINNKKLHSYLRIVTDGTLLEELKNNPTLLQKVNNKFINKNIWDIIIVDEAHEHNINMDIIIALSKQACYFNNKIKLIVVSATMDDDEPIYRRYFKSINDKLMFPIKSHFPIHPIIPNIGYFLPNPIYMDRRYHISPPGETTQYKVDEIYLDSEPSVIGKTDERIISDKAQKLGYKKVEEICAKTTSGEILFFANGKREILDAVKYLNQVLPSGNIALPFFSELNETYKGIISKINIKIDQIKNKRENIHEEWGENYIEDPTVPQGLYKRSIIIATNVAEASITIPRLTFVIDNGYAKVNRYKPNIDTTILEVQKISEASRLQRKGRVGRIGDGTVYYMYKKNARKFVRPKYKITQENIAKSMLGLLGEKTIKDININDQMNFSKLIVSSLINPNFLTLSNSDNISYSVKSGLLDIYKENYKVPFVYKKLLMTNPLISYTYHNYLNNTVFDLDINSNISINSVSKEFESSMFVFESGQLINNILDHTGLFYLIHPFENNIKRNIMNQIIKYDNKKTKLIPLTEYTYVISTLFNSNLLIDTNANLLYAYLTDINSIYRNWVKSELAVQVEKVATKLQTDIPNSITFISASAMGCLTEVVETVLFLQTISYSLKNLPDKDIKWITFKQTFYDSNIKSDLIFVYKLVQKIKSSFNNLMVFNINSKSVQLTLDIHSKKILDKFKKLSKKHNEPPKNFDGKLWNKLYTLKNNGTLSSEYKNIILSDNSTLDLIYSDIEKNKENIIIWCKKNLLNENSIINFIIKYGEYQINQFNITNIKVFDWSSKLSSNFNKQLTINTLEEKIIRSFIYGNPMQFTYSKNNKGIYGTIMNFNYPTVKFAEPNFSNSKSNSFLGQNETMTLLSNEFTHYLIYKEELNPLVEKQSPDFIDSLNVSILSQISPEWLIPAIPLLINPILSQDIKKITDYNGDNSYISYSNSWILQKFKKNIINNWNSNILIWDSEETPLMSEFYKSIYKYISSVLK
jgi:hypothetical protein